MAWWIGMDEAGLGPNLGPFVVTAVVWETPAAASAGDLWAELPEIFTSQPRDAAGRLLLADSKVAFQQSGGLAGLERTVLALLGGWEPPPRDLPELHRLVGADWGDRPREPWTRGDALRLPCEADQPETAAWSTRLRAAAEERGWRLAAVRAAVVQPREFNAALQRTGNKAAVTSGTHAAVLQTTRAIVGDDDVTIVCDKHGGRNRYAGLLSDVYDGAWVDTLAEGAACSAYRVGRASVRFEPRAERYAPVALASMIAKYLRELHMDLFNRFWQERLPHLERTAGYPVDAQRFLTEIEPLLTSLQIDRDVVWRAK